MPALAVCLRSHTPSFVLPVHTYKGKDGTLRPLRSYFRIYEAVQGWRCCVLGTHLPARRILSPHRGPQCNQPCWNILPDLHRQAVTCPNVTASFQSLGQVNSPWPLPPLSQSLLFTVCPGITSQREELPLVDSNPPSSFFLRVGKICWDSWHLTWSPHKLLQTHRLGTSDHPESVHSHIPP